METYLPVVTLPVASVEVVFPALMTKSSATLMSSCSFANEEREEKWCACD
ncbi:hypothetical protein [Haliscomenobacter sp.]